MPHAVQGSKKEATTVHFKTVKWPALKSTLGNLQVLYCETVVLTGTFRRIQSQIVWGNPEVLWMSLGELLKVAPHSPHVSFVTVWGHSSKTSPKGSPNNQFIPLRFQKRFQMFHHSVTWSFFEELYLFYRLYMLGQSLRARACTWRASLIFQKLMMTFVTTYVHSHPSCLLKRAGYKLNHYSSLFLQPGFSLFLQKRDLDWRKNLKVSLFVVIFILLYPNPWDISQFYRFPPPVAYRDTEAIQFNAMLNEPWTAICRTISSLH